MLEGKIYEKDSLFGKLFIQVYGKEPILNRSSSF